MTSKKQITAFVVLLVLVAIPLTVYLSSSRQTIQKEARFADIGISLAPSSMSLAVGQETTIAVTAATSGIHLIGATLDISLNRNHFDVVSVAPEKPNDYLPVKYVNSPISVPNQSAAQGTLLLTNVNELPFTFIYNAIDVTVPQQLQLPSGNFTIARVTLKAKNPGAGQIALLTSSSTAVGFNPGQTDVRLGIRSSTPVRYSILGDTGPAPQETSTPTPTVFGTPTPTPTPNPLCDLCGYCDTGSAPPDDYNACGQCLYTNPGPPPADPREDKAWTILGCIESSTQGFVQSAVAVAVPAGGGIGFLVFLIGSAIILTSGGNVGAVMQGKRLIIAGITMLICIIFAAFILRLAGFTVLNIPGFG